MAWRVKIGEQFVESVLFHLCAYPGVNSRHWARVTSGWPKCLLCQAEHKRENVRTGSAPFSAVSSVPHTQ